MSRHRRMIDDLIARGYTEKIRKRTGLIPDEILANREVDRTFEPTMDEAERSEAINGWKRAIASSRVNIDKGGE